MPTNRNYEHLAEEIKTREGSVHEVLLFLRDEMLLTTSGMKALNIYFDYDTNEMTDVDEEMSTLL